MLVTGRSDFLVHFKEARHPDDPIQRYTPTLLGAVLLVTFFDKLYHLADGSTKTLATNVDGYCPDQSVI